MTDFQKSLTRFLYVALVLFVVVAAVGMLGRMRHREAARSNDYGRGPGVTATGTCVVRTRPDLVEVTLAVRQSTRSAKDANDYVKSHAKAVIAMLRTAGIADKDIQTEHYYLSPEWDDHLKGMKWNAEEALRVRIRKFDGLADLLDAAVKSGANHIGRLDFTVNDLNELRSRGRAQAAKVARRKAQELASALGGKVGKLVSVDESYPGENDYWWENVNNDYSGRNNYAANSQVAYNMPANRADDSGREELTIKPGELAYTVVVTATYDLE